LFNCIHELYRLPESVSKQVAYVVFHNSAQKVVKDAIKHDRFQSIAYYQRNVLNQPMNTRQANALNLYLCHTRFLCQNQVLIICMTRDQLFHTYSVKSRIYVVFQEFSYHLTCLYLCLGGFGLTARCLGRRRVHPNGAQHKRWRGGAQ
jgi:hypothetical protein